MFDRSRIHIKYIAINCYYIRTHLSQIKCIYVTGSKIRIIYFIFMTWCRHPDSQLWVMWMKTHSWLLQPSQRILTTAGVSEKSVLWGHRIGRFSNHVVPRSADQQLSEDELMFCWSRAALLGHAFIALTFLPLFHERHLKENTWTA